ncbi:hypothetical protein [Massilia genomosp. 1]|uniref:Uncharacterized protein n=1 Tax=Massilia genomosp. 1 TaxID=2609280 RepID=A0ABX0MSB2_9BURK|nr:hypothetical protein [Massilia genomosp. 1]NHZ65306.1 hypothetical protein [Massilia genomosp. 1]
MAALSQSQHRMPSWSEPDAASVLQVMTDEQRFFDAEQYTLADFDTLLETCQMVRQAALSYYLFDTGADTDTSNKNDASKIMAAKQEVLSRKLIKYQDETFSLLAFQQRCFGVHLTLLSELTKTRGSVKLSQTQLEGVAQVRLGVVQAFLGAVQMAVFTEVSAANRHKLFASMARMAPNYAQALDLQARGELRNYFRQLHTTLPQEFHIYLDDFEKAMASSSCTGLCLI